jgi:hypothetical protein
MSKIDKLKRLLNDVNHPMSCGAELQDFTELAVELLPTLFEVLDGVTDVDENGLTGFWHKDGVFYLLPEISEEKSEIQITAENEEKIILATDKALSQHGWTLVGVNDGEDFIRHDDINKALEDIFAVEESYIYYTKDGKRKCVYLILGNGNYGLDVISDYSTGNGFDEIIDAVLENLGD